jgi:hypothetical protein
MRKRMSGSVLLLATLAFSLIGGDILGLAAQDPPNPAPTSPAPTPQTQTPQPQTDQPQTTTPRTNMAAEQTDLSGTYAGTFNCDALGLTGDTTLTITGNQFTTADGKSGRIVASTTGGYTAVALQTGDIPTGAAATAATAATPAPPTIVSLRARRRGNTLTLTPAPGSTMECRFTPTRGNVAGRRSRQRTPAPTGTEVSNPAAMPSPTTTQPTTPEQPVPSQTPSPTPTPEPTPEPPPEPSPTPSGSPTPMPSPTPSGSPTPEPSPTPSPTPNPSPGRPRG